MTRGVPRDSINRDGGGHGETPVGFMVFKSQPENPSQSLGGFEITATRPLQQSPLYQNRALAPAPAPAPATWTPALSQTQPTWTPQALAPAQTWSAPVAWNLRAPTPTSTLVHSAPTQAPITITDPNRYILIEPQRIHNNYGNEYTWQQDTTNRNFNVLNNGYTIYSAMHVDNINGANKVQDGYNLYVNFHPNRFQGLRLGEFVYFNFTNQDIFVGGIGNRGSLRVPANNPSQVSEIHPQTSPASKITYVNDSESRPQNLALLQSKSDLEARDGAIYKAQRLMLENKNLKIAPQRQLESIKKLEHELLFARREIDRLRQNEYDRDERDRLARDADLAEQFEKSRINSSRLKAEQEARAETAALRQQLVAAERDRVDREAETAELKKAQAADAKALANENTRLQIQKELAEITHEWKQWFEQDKRFEPDKRKQSQETAVQTDENDIPRLPEEVLAAARQRGESVQNDPAFTVNQWSGSAIQSDQIADLQRQISDQAARADAAEARADAAERERERDQAKAEAEADAAERERDQARAELEQARAAEQALVIQNTDLKQQIAILQSKINELKTGFEAVQKEITSFFSNNNKVHQIEVKEEKRSEGGNELSWNFDAKELLRSQNDDKYNIFKQFKSFKGNISSTMTEEQKKDVSKITLLKIKIIKLGMDASQEYSDSNNDSINIFLNEIGINKITADDSDIKKFCEKYFNLGQQYKKIVDDTESKDDILKMMSDDFGKDTFLFTNNEALKWKELKPEKFTGKIEELSKVDFGDIASGSEDGIKLFAIYEIGLAKACEGHKEITGAISGAVNYSGQITPEIAKVFVELDEGKQDKFLEKIDDTKKQTLKDLIKKEKSSITSKYFEISGRCEHEIGIKSPAIKNMIKRFLWIKGNEDLSKLRKYNESLLESLSIREKKCDPALEKIKVNTEVQAEQNLAQIFVEGISTLINNFIKKCSDDSESLPTPVFADTPAPAPAAPTHAPATAPAAPTHAPAARS